MGKKERKQYRNLIVGVVLILFFMLSNQLSAVAETYKGVRNESLKMEITPKGEPEKLKNEEKRIRMQTSFESTGLFLYQGEELTVIVDGNPENLELKVGQWGGYNDQPYILNGTQTKAFTEGSLKLKAGENKFTRNFSGGMVYLVNYSKNKTEKVTLKGGVKVPHFIFGKTTVKEFKKQLKTNIDVPFIELTSDSVIATLRMDRTKDIFEKGNQVEIFTKYMTQVTDMYNDVSGFVTDSNAGVAENSKQKLHIMNPSFGAGLFFATDYFVGMHSGGGAKDRAIFSAPLDRGEWGLFHEIGHTYQLSPYNWTNMTEVTVNIFSDYASKHWTSTSTDRFSAGSTPREKVKSYFNQLESDPSWNYTRELKEAPNRYHESTLALFANLYRVFGDDYLRALHQNYRALIEDEQPKNDTEKMQLFILLSSEITNRNLLPFFDHWCFPVEESTRKKVEEMNLPQLEKEIWKDIFATKEEETAGTYRILEAVKPYTVPAASVLGAKKIEFEELTHVNLDSELEITAYSTPIKSAVTVKGIDIPDKVSTDAQVGQIILKNEANIANKIPFDLQVTSGNSVAMSGMNGYYLRMGYDHVSKELLAFGNKNKIMWAYPEKIYPKVRIFNKDQTKIKLAIEGKGQETGENFANKMNKTKLELGDIVEIYNSEASKRMDRYKNNEGIAKDPKRTTFYYKITENGWVEVDKPNYVNIKEKSEYQIGEEPKIEDFITESEAGSGEALQFKWGISPKTIIPARVSLDSYLTQEAIIIAYTKNEVIGEYKVLISFQLNNTINIARHGGYGTFLVYDPKVKTLKALGADPYTLNGADKDQTKPFMTLTVQYKDSAKKPVTIKAMNNTFAKRLTEMINQENLILSEGDQLVIEHKRLNQQGINLRTDIKKYITNALTAFTDNQKTDTFETNPVKFVITADGLSLQE